MTNVMVPDFDGTVANLVTMKGSDGNPVKGHWEFDGDSLTASTKSGVVEYTVAGRLKGHLVIGSEMVNEVAGKIKDFPNELLEQLQHLILSHHGRQEFGSPTVPMTVEAFVLSFVDDLDAKMNLTEQLRRKMNSEEKSWTDYQRTLERYLYLGGFQEKSSSMDKEEPAQSRRQPSLF